jgi:DNA-binding Lrp family transcriptional regulator
MTTSLAVVNNPPKPILRTEDKVMVTTIIPELAAEIGLNESILLRQLAHWIKTTNNLRDGQWWTYQTLSGMQKEAFPYWSIATISRTAKKLEEAGYIQRTAVYNKRRNDTTFWYALNVEKLSTLKSITVVLQNEKGIVTDSVTALQDEKPVLQNENPLVLDDLQNATTLPEDSSEVSTEQTTTPVVSVVDKSQPIDTPVSRVFVAIQQLEILHDKLRYAVKDWLKEYSEQEILTAIDTALENRRNGTKIKSVTAYLNSVLANQRREAEVQKQVPPSPKIEYYVPDPPISDEERQKALSIMAENRKKLAKPNTIGGLYGTGKAAGE